jgi:hypothetical protein
LKNRREIVWLKLTSFPEAPLQQYSLPLVKPYPSETIWDGVSVMTVALARLKERPAASAMANIDSLGNFMHLPVVKV